MSLLNAPPLTSAEFLGGAKELDVPSLGAEFADGQLRGGTRPGLAKQVVAESPRRRRHHGPRHLEDLHSDSEQQKSVSTGPLSHSLVLPCSHRSRAPLRLFIRSLTYSLPSS